MESLKNKTKASPSDLKLKKMSESHFRIFAKTSLEEQICIGDLLHEDGTIKSCLHTNLKGLSDKSHWTEAVLQKSISSLEVRRIEVWLEGHNLQIFLHSLLQKPDRFDPHSRIHHDIRDDIREVLAMMSLEDLDPESDIDLLPYLNGNSAFREKVLLALSQTPSIKAKNKLCVNPQDPNSTTFSNHEIISFELNTESNNLLIIEIESKPDFIINNQ